MGLSLIAGPLAEDSAAKLKRSQLNVCTVYVYCVPFSLMWLKLVQDWPVNFCQYWDKWYGLGGWREQGGGLRILPLVGRQFPAKIIKCAILPLLPRVISVSRLLRIFSPALLD
jgi:hypothetical protein